MKTLFMVILALAVILGMTAFAQYSSTEPMQKDQGAQAPLKSIDGTVKVDGDKITVVADKDQKSWAVENPEALKGHEGHHVQVKAHVDADKSSIHVTEVKMLKGSETKKEEMKKSHIGRPQRRPFSSSQPTYPSTLQQSFVARHTPAQGYLRGRVLAQYSVNAASSVFRKRSATSLVWKGRSSGSSSRLSLSVISSAVLGFLILFNARGMRSSRRRLEFGVCPISGSSPRKMNLVYSWHGPDISIGFNFCTSIGNAQLQAVATLPGTRNY